MAGSAAIGGGGAGDCTFTVRCSTRACPRATFERAAIILCGSTANTTARPGPCISSISVRTPVSAGSRGGSWRAASFTPACVNLRSASATWV